MHYIRPWFRLMRRSLVVGITLFTAAAIAQSQPGGACNTLVREALQAANSACSGTSRNEVCYGNVLGFATPADGVNDLRFDAVGDIAAVTQIKALQLSPLDEAASEWGVALMQLQANLPDTLPGQNVTFLIFGDVTIEENTGEQVRVDTTVNTAANLRLGPNTTGPVLGSVPANASVVASGKTVNSLGETWVRVRYTEYRTQTGWILAELVDIDLGTLPDVPSDSLTLNPMQAFYFRTGIGQTQCASAPVSGVVVQTPDGLGKVNFSVNGIEIALGSTAFLSAPEGVDSTCLSLLTGDADLQSAGRVVDLNPGERSCVPLNDDGTSGPPGPPEPFDAGEIGSLAVVIDTLPKEVEIPDPAPTRAPTALPTAVPTAEPTEQPPAPPPAVTNEPPGRYVSINRNRQGVNIELTAEAGPDEAESFYWDWGETSASGQNVSFWFWSGAQVDIWLTVCWADGECIVREFTVRIPECAIDQTESTTLNLQFEGFGVNYFIKRTNEKCEFATVGTFGESNPIYSSAAHVGEIWQVVEDFEPFNVVREYHFWDTTPIDDVIFGTPELNDMADAGNVSPTPSPPHFR